MCDRNHPQDPEIDKSTYNHLVDAVVYGPPPLKKRYFDTLRHAFETWGRGWLDAEVRAIAADIGVDARKDAALWNTSRGGFDDSVQRLLGQIAVRRSQLENQLKSLSSIGRT
jgi:hypothetical protein